MFQSLFPPLPLAPAFVNILATIFFVSLFLYLWLYNFIDGLPLKALRHRLSTSQGRLHLLRTAFSFGFLKSSIRRFLHHVYRYLVCPLPIVKLGSPLPRDCDVVCSITGQTVRLSTLLSSGADDKPIVITFGSWS